MDMISLLERIAVPRPNHSEALGATASFSPPGKRWCSRGRATMFANISQVGEAGPISRVTW
ncbi:MAG: hypothetical protein E4G96_10760 [Chrysiogenales bacterium]|nr:MAG: hypothetical protein E4G96_10760 [Chrysiogenales bacterium]